MAIVESRTALEVLLDGILMKAFSGMGIDHVRRALKIPKGSRILDLQDALRSSSVNNKLKHGLRNATGKSPADDTALWRKWLKAKKIREDVVHYGQSVNRQDADIHVSAVENITKLPDIETISKNWKVTYVQSGSVTTEWFAP